MKKIVAILITMMLVLAACSSTEAPQGQVQVIPTEPTLEGSVDITFPMSGSIIYAETIVLEGTSSGIPDSGFYVQLLAPDDSRIAEATVQPEDDGSWAVEIVHQYTGDPTEVTILASTSPEPDGLDYDIESIALAKLENRPEGVFGTILFPEEGTSAGGDFIEIIGRGSGFFENSFALQLVNTEDEVVSELPVMMKNPNFVDDMLWEAEFPRNDYIGNATLRMAYQDMESGETIIIDSINLVVSAVAG